MKRFLNVRLISLLVFLFVGCSEQHDKPEQPAVNDKPETLSNWENQKFSMFIHWGLYSIPAGIWEGEKITGYSEQIKGHANIASEDYRKLASQFNPVNWNADSVVLLAKKAGMKSIIITSKHHDGFCLFDSEYTDFNVVDASPYKKDVLKELSEACKQHNLNFGVYFSLIDWDYEYALPFESVRNSDSIPPLHHQYNLNQVEELMSNYGEISEIWFDMGSPTYKQSNEIARLINQLQPNCMISGRLWNDQGDFVVMGDNLKPDFKMGVPWQTPASMFNETWSYRSWQERPSVEAKITEKIHDLISVISMGGNYLLNIGPKADGSIVPFERKVLEGIGEWMSENGDAIYGTKATSIDEQSWGAISEKDGKLYLYVINFPENNKLIIEGLNIDIKKAYLLSDPDLVLESSILDIGFELDLTNVITLDKYATVIVLTYDGELLYIPQNTICPNQDGMFVLNMENATKYHSYSGHDYYSSKPTVVKLKWNLFENNQKDYQVNVKFTSDESGMFKLLIDDEIYLFSSVEKGGLQQHTIESVDLSLNQVHEFELALEKGNNPHKALPLENIVIKLEEL